MQSAIYIFIGDEGDHRTRSWGIRCGQPHRIKFNEESFQAHIQVGDRWITCPYGSKKAFLKNWRESELPRGIQCDEHTEIIATTTFSICRKQSEKKKRFVPVDSLNKKSFIRRIQAINNYIRRTFWQ